MMGIIFMMGIKKLPRIENYWSVSLNFRVWCCCRSYCGYLCTFQVYEGKPVDPVSGKSIYEKGMVKMTWWAHFQVPIM